MSSLEEIGINKLKTRKRPFSGRLFESKADFIVEEILSNREVKSVEKTNSVLQPGEKNDFVVFTLIKEGLSTSEALRQLSRSLKISIKRFGYHGNKDKNAITSQEISIFKADAGRLENRYPNMFIKDIKYGTTGCKIGNIYGNKFTVSVRDFSGSDSDLEEFRKEASAGIPNFFGPQRFGSSALNIDVSKAVLKKDFKSAIHTFLFAVRNEGKEAAAYREMLSQFFSSFVLEDTQIDKEKAESILNSAPRFMYLEASLVSRLLQAPHDYIGAFRLIPKYLRLLILQSYQSYIFNLVLSNLLKESNVSVKTIPMIGYDLEIDKIEDESLRRIMASVLEKEAVSLQELKLTQMPETSLKTFTRDAFVIPENLAFERKDSNLIISFQLKGGAYATILLTEMLGRSEI